MWKAARLLDSIQAKQERWVRKTFWRRLLERLLTLDWLWRVAQKWQMQISLRYWRIRATLISSCKNLRKRLNSTVKRCPWKRLTEKLQLCCTQTDLSAISTWKTTNELFKTVLPRSWFSLTMSNLTWEEGLLTTISKTWERQRSTLWRSLKERVRTNRQWRSMKRHNKQLTRFDSRCTRKWSAMQRYKEALRCRSKRLILSRKDRKLKKLKKSKSLLILVLIRRYQLLEKR